MVPDAVHNPLDPKVLQSVIDSEEIRVLHAEHHGSTTVLLPGGWHLMQYAALMVSKAHAMLQCRNAHIHSHLSIRAAGLEGSLQEVPTIIHAVMVPRLRLKASPKNTT